MTIDKQTLINTALDNIEKRFGKGSIMRQGSFKPTPVEAISSGCLSIDIATGIGGFPRGRVTEISGVEGGGKTTLTLHTIAEAQKAGLTAAFIDVEHAIDPNYAVKLGVDINAWLISQPSSAEEALEIAQALIESKSVDILVVDSVAALVPQAELNGEMGDSLPGLKARLMGQALRKLIPVIHQTNTCVIFINQIRIGIGVTHGTPEFQPGGKALKYAASLRLDIRRIAAVKTGEEVIGNRTRLKVSKNKLSPPFKECEFDIIYGEGISRDGDLIDLAVLHGIVDKSGSWLAYNGDKLGQGKEKAKTALKDNPALHQKIEADVYAKCGLTQSIK